MGSLRRAMRIPWPRFEGYALARGSLDSMSQGSLNPNVEVSNLVNL